MNSWRRGGSPNRPTNPTGEFTEQRPKAGRYGLQNIVGLMGNEGQM